MAQSEPDHHLDEEQRAKCPEVLEISGVKRSHPADESHQEQQSRRGAHRTFVEHGNVDPLDALAKCGGVGGVLCGRRHGNDYTRGGIPLKPEGSGD